MNNNMVKQQKKSGIYQLRNIRNGKVYIGQSKNMSYRKTCHFRSLKDNNHYNQYLQRSFNKYGHDSFVFEVLEYCKEDELNEKERHWIEVKESEYSTKGYNAAYAYTLFSKYDDDKKINVSKRKPNIVNYTEEVKKKFQKSISEYWENEDNRIRSSLNKSEVSYDTIVKVKKLLKEDLEISVDEIAELLCVSVNTVIHIRNLASHSYILKEYNLVIKNRYAISSVRKAKVVIGMYRDGESYQSIADETGMDHRNVMRIAAKNKSVHDDRCRLNAINRSIIKRNSLIRTLSKMGKNTVEISKMLKVSRNTISKVLKQEDNLFFSLGDTRGKVIVNKYHTV